VFAAPLLVMLKILAVACGPPRLVGEIRVLERRAVKTKRSGASIAAIVLFVVAILWFALYYSPFPIVRNFPIVRKLGVLNPIFAAVLLVAAIITGIVVLATGGSAARPANANAEVARTNGFSIASLVLSLVGLSVLAIIFGHVSKSQMKRTGEAGSGLATAGLILGYVELIATAGAVFYVLASAR
jgi:hypothetical protein